VCPSPYPISILSVISPAYFMKYLSSSYNVYIYVYIF
jgi:hypothetical protein